ncbi:MAG: MFS transporter, partial [Clostridia bacterium]|nr:MFS transporter [Clostridia bacterium]
MERKTKVLKLGCYATNISMSVVGNLSPLLFITFRSLYGISYSLLGLLVLVNFFTQLTVDLIFSFFSHRFNISKTVKLTPFLTVIGLLVYALWPFFFPNSVYIGLVIGTLIFSASSGLSEVLISPVIAALPSDDPEHEMSKLHSTYAWGVVFVIVVSTLFLLAFGNEHWQYLSLLFIIIPLSAFLLLNFSDIPDLNSTESTSPILTLLKNKTFWLCVVGIFLGGASECTMAQWCSGYLEKAVGIPKIYGDIFGVAMFSVMLGLGRTLYSKYGKNISSVLLAGAIGASVCYFISAISNVAVLGLIACAFTGLCTSMLWPGSLIAVADLFPQGGVFIYAMMAAGGDLGASVGPQLVG